MAKVKNISTGPRGAYKDGVLIMAERGEVIEADDFNDEWFAKAGSAEARQSDELPRNVPKLRAIAKDEEIDLGTAATADEIIAAIEKGRAAKEAAAA